MLGSRSTDADGDHLTFDWLIVSKPLNSTAYLDSSSAVRPSFLVDLPGRYEVRLRVSDGGFTSQADTVDVTTSNVAP